MITDFFNSTAVIYQQSTSQNEMGGVSKNWTTRIASLSCRVSSKNIIEGEEFGKLTIREGWKLYCSVTSTNKAIDESDKVTVGGRTFLVTGNKNPALLDRHLEIDMEVVE